MTRTVITRMSLITLSALAWLVTFTDAMFDSDCREYNCGRRNCREVLGSLSREKCRRARSECSYSQCGDGGGGVSCSGSECGPIAFYIVGGVFGCIYLTCSIVGIVIFCVFKKSGSRTQTYQPYPATTVQPQPAYNAYNAGTYSSPVYGAPATAGPQTNNFDYVA